MLHRLKEFGLFNAVARRTPPWYGACRGLLAEAERWRDRELDAWVERHVSRTLARARQLEGYRNAPRANDLASWPILTKADVAGRESAFGHKGMLPAYRAATGGTTGVPLAVRRSHASIVFEQAAIDHICATAGLDLPRARMAVLRGDFVKPPSDTTPPFWKPMGANMRVFSSFHLSRRTFSDYLSALDDFAPDVLACYPSSLQHFIALCEQSGRAVSIKYVLTSSERMPPDVIAAARRVLGARVIDYYGQAERVVIAYAIDGSGYRCLPVYGLPEFVHESDGRARVLGTSFWNERQVFVRYDTGDIALVPGSDAATLRDVQLGRRTFPGIDGRASERIDLPDGRRIIGLNHIPRGVANAASIQLRKSGPNAVEVFVVPLEGFGRESEDIIRNNFYAKFPADVMLRICKVDAPIRTKAGKAPLLVPDERAEPVC
jgi:phenylacetate-CoA ligase